MNCLFCKHNSDNSKSIEHIIPESLGNKDHILPKGFVCDSCNQYFALKIEKPLLEQPYFINARHRARIENKKGRIPAENAIIISPELAKAAVSFEKDNKTIINIYDKDQADRIFSSPQGAMIIPILSYPDSRNKILSRFLAKVAVEALLYYLLKEEGWIDEVMNKSELDEIKSYARYGIGVNFWPYYQRRIYPEDATFFNPKTEVANYEILHEFKILATEENHYYFVLALMGIEYAINLGGPAIDSYEKWLVESNNKSILDDPDEKQMPK
jgi:hypothetical protein